jgi:hypothetical protein
MAGMISYLSGADPPALILQVLVRQHWSASSGPRALVAALTGGR